MSVDDCDCALNVLVPVAVPANASALMTMVVSSGILYRHEVALLTWITRAHASAIIAVVGALLPSLNTVK